MVSIVGAIIAIPLLYGIIWFEENNHFRTLINQLVASICWYLIFYILLVQPIAIVLYINGPLNSFICSIDIIIKNVMSMQAIFLLEAIVITKYVFVHLLKNPVAIDDNFLRLFINLSSGMLPLTIHVCVLDCVCVLEFKLVEQIKVSSLQMYCNPVNAWLNGNW